MTSQRIIRDQSLLETEFPITNPGSRISRSSSRDRNTISSSLGRNSTSGHHPRASGGYVMSASTASPAPEWQYEAVTSSMPKTNGSMSRIQTTFQPTPQRPVLLNQKTGSTHLNRSSSLRRAYSDVEDSSMSDNDQQQQNTGISEERQPLNPRKQTVAGQISSQSSSATSDYHSDIQSPQRHHHRKPQHPICQFPKEDLTNPHSQLLQHTFERKSRYLPENWSDTI